MQLPLLTAETKKQALHHRDVASKATNLIENPATLPDSKHATNKEEGLEKLMITKSILIPLIVKPTLNETD
jgi:hypothetical protein